MGEISFDFDAKKATEVILYISRRVSESTLHSITHLLYFADKTSLEKYGRLIVGDDYFAMEHGPVPSNTYNLLKAGRLTEEFGFKVEGHQVIPLRAPELDFLSASDIECLESALEMYGGAPFWKRRRDSHDEAWEAAWESRGESNANRIPIESIVAMLEDSEELLHFLANRHSS